MTRLLGDSICSSVKWGLCSPSQVWKDQKVSGCEDSHKGNAALLSVPLLPVMTVEQKPGLILTGVYHTCRMWPVCPYLRTQAFLELREYGAGKHPCKSDPQGRQSGDKARPKAAAHGWGALPPISSHPHVCPTQVLAEGRGTEDGGVQGPEREHQVTSAWLQQGPHPAGGHRVRARPQGLEMLGP